MVAEALKHASFQGYTYCHMQGLYPHRVHSFHVEVVVTIELIYKTPEKEIHSYGHGIVISTEVSIYMHAYACMQHYQPV